MIYLNAKEQEHMLNLNGKKLLIRPFMLEDAKNLFTAFRKNIDHLSHWWLLDINHEQISLEFATNLTNLYVNNWNTANEYHYIIIDIESSDIVGEVSIHAIDYVHQFASMGYWLSNNSILKGNCHLFTAFIACRALVELNLNRIEFFIADENIKSIKSIQKLPVQNEGLMRNRLKTQYHVYDAFVFSLIDTDLHLLQRICLPLLED
jgi:ribosomal-protein-serine acetyltransferase